MSCWSLLLLCLALWLTSLTVTAQGHVVKWPKGKYLWVRCQSDKNLTVTRWIFCKNDCKEEDVLVQTSTSGSHQKNGRYEIVHWKEGSSPQDYITVFISDLRLRDSGRYRCFWDRPGQSEYREFMLEVTDGAESGPEAVVLVTEGEDFSFSFLFNPGQKKTFCRNACSEEDVLLTTTRNEAQSGRYRIQTQKYKEHFREVTVTITDLNTTDSGLYQCRVEEKSRTFWISVAAAPPPGVRATQPPSETTTEQEPTTHPGDSSKTNNLVLVLVPVSGIIVIVTAVVLSICCRRRSGRSTDGGGTQNPERDFVSVRPQNEHILQEMEPINEQLNQD